MHTGAVPEFTVGDRLRKARECAGMEQSELAAAIEVDRKTVSNYERGHVKPRPIVMAAWALATGVDRQWLETGRKSQIPGPGGDPLTFGSEGWRFESSRARPLFVAA